MKSKGNNQATKDEATPVLVPKLRFPEFLDAEAWHFTTLDSVCEVLNNRRKPITGNNRTPGPYPYFGASGIVDYVGDFIFDERLLLIGEDGAKWGTFEKTAFIAEGRFWVNNHAHVLKPFAASDTLLENYLTMQDLSPFVTGTAPPKLTLSKLKGILVPLPPKSAEQHKIAKCLSSIDELIAAQAQKLNALKTHKKGLMQQLFPREGETQPRLRFPEFHNVGEWSSDSLGSLFDTSSGGTPDRTKDEYWNGNIPWITTSLVDFNIITQADEFITEAGLNNSSAKVFPEQTILMAMYGQGKTRGQVAMLGIKAATNQACASILPRKDIDPRFVFLNLGSRYEELRGLSNSGGQENLSQGLIQGLQFSYPNDQAEQQRIAECLSSLDALITAETQKYEALKTHKKGLMQQLFPSPEAATA
jgi:type I restriction enzyme S subunit